MEVSARKITVPKGLRDLGPDGHGGTVRAGNCSLLCGRTLVRTNGPCGRVHVPGIGAVEGFSLFRDVRAVRYMAGDSAHWASLGADDAAWAMRSDADSLALLNAPVYWIRFHFSVDSALAKEHLLLHLTSSGKLELWLDGAPLVRTDMQPTLLPKEISGLGTPASILAFTLGDLAPDAAHVLAIRFVRPARGGTVLDLRALVVRAEAYGTLHRSVLHHGVFIGVNALMLLMALIHWRLSRHDRVWPWFAGLSALNAFMAFSALIDDASLGIPEGTLRALNSISTLAMLLPMVLCVVVLLVLLDKLDRKRLVLYAGSAVVISAALAGITRLGSVLGLDPSLGGLAAMVLLLTVVGIGYVWLAVDVLRFGWQALRTPGYIRWMGAGIVLSLLAPMLKYMPFLVKAMVLQDNGTPFRPWMATASDYLSYIAIPLSIIIALAIRAATQHRLLARQRDELDLEVQERTAELRLERDRSEELLLNILPQEVAEELKRNGSAEAKHFDRATVLFTDFQGFTSMSAQVGPGELLAELNACFKAFDDIIARYGIEKIKTIGDAYMCASGLPDPQGASPTDVVFAALDMQDFMAARHAERSARGQLAFRMRAGIHTGPVVAGIVGVKKFQYDIWGDTVNTAARMESSGVTGRVNISADTHATVKDTPGLAFTSRGLVEAKGKGSLEMWFVERA
jgi:class 3 adenylate cyclase